MLIKQFSAIESLVSEPAWVSKAMVQINKDLGMIGLPNIEEEVPSTAQQLAVVLAPYFDNIIKYKPNKWAEFLYRADIPEELLQQVMRSDATEIPEVAFLIVQREMFKVYAREKYTG